MNICVYDIETVPLSDKLLSRVEPVFEAPSNYKDPEKIAAAIAEKRAAWKERAALSPVTGRVAMIGLLGRLGVDHCIMTLAGSSMGCDASLDQVEASMLEAFWNEARDSIAKGYLMVGFNSHRFDIPFLVRRSWALGLNVPIDVCRRLQIPWVDLMERFTMGAPGEFVSLDTVAKFFGVGQKNGNCLEIARQLAECPSKAIAYLENDLDLTLAIAKKMGVADLISPPVQSLTKGDY